MDEDTATILDCLFVQCCLSRYFSWFPRSFCLALSFVCRQKHTCKVSNSATLTNGEMLVEITSDTIVRSIIFSVMECYFNGTPWYVGIPVIIVLIVVHVTVVFIFILELQDNHNVGGFYHQNSSIDLYRVVPSFFAGFVGGAAAVVLWRANSGRVRYYKDGLMKLFGMKQKRRIWRKKGHGYQVFDLFIFHSDATLWIHEELIPKLKEWEVTFVSESIPGKPVACQLYNAVCETRFTMILMTNELIRYSWLNYTAMLLCKKGLDSAIICEIEELDVSLMSEPVFNIYSGAVHHLVWPENSWHRKKMFWKDLKEIVYS